MSINYNRQLEESLTDYHLRLFDNAKIYDLTSEDIAELLNKESGYSYGESKWRKDYAAYLRWKNYISEKDLSQNELDDFTIKKLDLQKERNKLAAEKNEINKWLRELARSELAYEKITDSIASLPPIKIPKTNTSSKNTSKKAVLDLADSHYGKEGKILGLENEIIAEYNIEIFEKRMWQIFEQTVRRCKENNITDLVVLNLGDSVDGMLRMSQLQFIQIGSTDQTMGYASFLSEWLNKLSEHVSIEYYMVLGNHSETRVLSSNRGDFKNENMERIIGWFLKERLSNNKNIVIHEPKNLVYFDVLGTKILAAHGQDEKNLESSLKEYKNIYNRPVHIFKTGHKHHLDNKTVGMDGYQNVEYIQSPAICGIDEYSVSLKKVSKPGTLLTIFEEGYGKSNTYDIKLN